MEEGSGRQTPQKDGALWRKVQGAQNRKKDGALWRKLQGAKNRKKMAPNGGSSDKIQEEVAFVNSFYIT